MSAHLAKISTNGCKARGDVSRFFVKPTLAFGQRRFHEIPDHDFAHAPPSSPRNSVQIHSGIFWCVRPQRHGVLPDQELYRAPGGSIRFCGVRPLRTRVVACLCASRVLLDCVADGRLHSLAVVAFNASRKVPKHCALNVDSMLTASKLHLTLDLSNADGSSSTSSSSSQDTPHDSSSSNGSASEEAVGDTHAAVIGRPSGTRTVPL